MSGTDNGVPAIPQPFPALGNTFGAFYISLLFTAILYGFTNLQVVMYLQTQWKYDRVVYKIMVGWLWSLDTIHFIFISHMLYYHLITNFANPPALSVIVWSFKGQIIITVIIIVSVHCLYAHRLWILGKGRKRIFSLVQVAVIALDSGLSVFLCHVISRCHLYTDLQMVIWEPITVLSVLACNDFLVAASMCYLLVLSRTGFSETDTMIKRIVLYVCGSGCLTSVCSMAVIITCAVMPDNAIYLAIDFLLSKLYVNSFIALLNSRNNAERFGDVRVPTLGAAPYLVKYQDNEEHQTYLGVRLKGRRSRQTLYTNASGRKDSAGSPLDLESTDVSAFKGTFPDHPPTSALTL